MVIFKHFCGAYTYIIHDFRSKVKDCFGLCGVSEGLYLHIWGGLGVDLGRSQGRVLG